MLSLYDCVPEITKLVQSSLKKQSPTCMLKTSKIYHSILKKKKTFFQNEALVHCALVCKVIMGDQFVQVYYCMKMDDTLVG